MRLIEKLGLRFRALFRRRQVEDELERELQFHLDQEIGEKIAGGMSADEARRAALRSIGSLPQWKEACRDMRGLGVIDGLRQDFHYAFRTLSRHPGFALTAVLTLTLGIGATTVVFSVVDSMLINSVLFDEPDRLVEIYDWGETGGGPVQPGTMLPVWRAQRQIFDQVEAHWEGSFLSVGGPEPEILWASQLTVGMLDFLGVGPQPGRGFAPDESGAPVVIISHGLWQRRFGGDPQVLGQSLDLDGNVYTIIGVMPPWFRFPVGRLIALWIPFDPLQPNPLSGRGGVTPIARLRNGLSIPDADREVSRLAPLLNDTLPPGRTARLQPLRRLSGNAINPGAYFVARPRTALSLILGAAGLVLLAACANAAGLFLSRGWSRRREIAIRAAIGSGRSRLVRQMLVETLVVAAAAGMLGLLLARVAVDTLAVTIPPDLVELSLNPLDLDLRAAGWAAGASLLAALIAAAAPAIGLLRREVTAVLTGQALPGGSPSRLRGMLIATETAVALLLLISAGLMVRSLWTLTHVEMGFAGDDVFVAEPAFRGPAYSDPASRRVAMDELLGAFRGVPGVIAAAQTDAVPLQTFVISFGEIEADTGGRLADAIIATHGVSDDYFRTMGIPLYQGQVFDPDTARPDQIVITRGLADKLWPDADPIGRRFRLERTPLAEWSTVIGVVRDVRSESPTAPGDDYLEVYRPVPTDPEGRGMRYLVVKTDGQDSTLVSLRRQIRGVDPGLPVSIRPIEDLFSDTLVMPRFQTQFLAGLALVTAFLACTGIYTVVAYETRRQTREIAIRLALGATRSRLIREVTWPSLRAATLGLIAGGFSAFALTRLMSSMLYEVRPVDPLTFVVGPVLLLTAVSLASYVPARRASRGDPMASLRHE